MFRLGVGVVSGGGAVVLTHLNLSIHPPARACTDAEPTREQVRTAVEIVCDYLNDAWSKKLMEHCGLTEVRFD